jgi:ABC-type nickel/cobalt efflux system permease component RcnA
VGVRVAALAIQTWKHTIVAAQQKVEHGLQSENTQEVPADTRHPARVHVPGRDAGLEHALELDRQGKWQLHDNVAAEEGIDPAHDESVGDDHGHLVFHHPHHAIHGAGIAQGVRRCLAAVLGVLEVCARLESSCQGVAAVVEAPLGQNVMVASEVHAVHERSLLAHRLLV